MKGPRPLHDGAETDRLVTEAASTYQRTCGSTCPSGVLRHLVTRKHVRDTSVRRRVAGRHYPIHRRRCDTLQHRRFHAGSVGVRGSSPLSSTLKTRSGQCRSGFSCLAGSSRRTPCVLNLIRDSAMSALTPRWNDRRLTDTQPRGQVLQPAAPTSSLTSASTPICAK